MPPAIAPSPSDTFAGDVPLVAVERGGYVGSLHRGSIAVAGVDGAVVASAGNPDQPVFLRSAAKPVQVLPALLSGGVDRFGLTECELAVLCASHSGEPRHIEAVLAVLDKLDLPESALRCGTHPPIDEESAAARVRAGIPPSPACNNCSGAHTGMLVACRAMGWDLATYGQPDHPLQVQTREILARFVDLPLAEIQFGIDNCAVPTFRLPLRRAAMLFARLASGAGLPPDLAEATGRVYHAMTRYPEMIGGEHSFDTQLMRAAGHGLLVKGGAEAFQGVGIRSQRRGLAAKITDGNARALPPPVLCLLAAVDAITPDVLADLQEWAEPELDNLQGETVGRLRPVFAASAS